jgi:integrase
MRRNRRAAVEDRWRKTIIEPNGTKRTVPSAREGVGLRWMARYVDSQGRERTKSFGRKSDAVSWLDNETTGHMTGTWADPKKTAVTFGAIAEKWISTKAHRSPKTVAGYRSLLDTIVLPRWRDVSLRDVQFEDLQVWVSSLSVDGSVRFEGKGLSASRVRQAHQLVGAVLKFAVKSRHLAVNPVEAVELPGLPETEQRYLTHDQLHRVAVASGRLRTLVLVLGYCGLRFGEAAALRVSDVDIEGRWITVRRSVTYVRKAGLIEGATKNHTTRKVPVPAFLARLIDTEISDRDDNALVFASARGGGYLTLGQARYTFAKAAAVVDKCAGVRLQDLRHTCASLAIREGANVKVVQKLLGHKTATLTLDRYGHLYPDDLHNVATAFDSAAATAADWLRTGPALNVVTGNGNTR